MLGWLGTVTAGHTKRITTNAIVLSFYSIGNAASPFMWKAQYRPRCDTISLISLLNLHSHYKRRNRVPWSAIVASEFAFALVFLAIRFYLIAENSRRDREKSTEQFDDAYVVIIDENGAAVKEKVDKVRAVYLNVTPESWSLTTSFTGIPRPDRQAKPRLPLRSLKNLWWTIGSMIV